VAFLARQPEYIAPLVVLQSAKTSEPLLECEPLQRPRLAPEIMSGGTVVQTFSLLAPIPEASTLVLALLGTVGISMLRRRRR